MKQVIKSSILGLKKWIAINIIFALVLLAIRLVFFIALHFRIELSIDNFLTVLTGYKYDLMFVAHTISWMSIPYLLIYNFFPKGATRISYGLIIAYSVIASLLTEYYCNLMMPLDHVIFAYSIEELKGAASSSSSISITPFIYFIVTVGLCALIVRLLRKFQVKLIPSLLLFIAAIAISFSFNYKKTMIEERYSDSHSSFVISTNQPTYSFWKIIDHIDKKNSQSASNSGDYQLIVESYRNLFPENEYPYKEYPFYRKSNYEDVLGDYLNKTEDGLPPNFVFIIAEGFGQSLTGREIPTISFTPFIDSLKGEGLYWKNCLSTTQRTFGVLPAIFSSAPQGEKGFAHFWSTLPLHNSLLNDMKRNNYNISYFYGGCHDFDRYDSYLKSNNLDYIFVPKIDVIDSAMYKIMNENNRWGLDDEETFNCAMNYKDTSDIKTPYTDIYMTLTTHEPFLLPDIERYEKMVEEMVNNSTTISDLERNIVLKNLNVFACYLYMDQSIEKLFNYYKSKEEFKNTIFVITGDHRTSYFHTGNEIRKYNVPLVIYSPLLKENKEMNAVVSHLNITPTINAYLSNNYNYNVDKHCHWLAGSLDTCTSFRNKQKMAFMLNNRDVVEFLEDNYFICRQKLFEFDSNLCVTQVDNSVTYDRLKTNLDNYHKLSVMAVNNSMLMPIDLENAKIIVDSFYDFDDAEDWCKKHITKSNDNSYLYADSLSEFIPLYPYKEIEDECHTINVDIAFNIMSYDTLKLLPPLVVSIGDFYTSTHLLSPTNTTINTGKTEFFKKNICIHINEKRINQTLKVYLWNKGKSTFMIDDVHIRVSEH